MRGQHRRHHGVDFFAAGHVDPVGRHACAGAGKLAGGFAHARFIDVAQHDDGALGGEALRGGKADASGGTGDDGNPTLQFHLVIS
ncbi:hypothetical protein D9M68_596180 [compost metagenome]